MNTNLPEPVCIQLWSIQGLSPERKAQYDAILNNGQPSPNLTDHSEQLDEKPREKVEKKSEQITPWKSQLESIEWLKAIATKVRTFCDSPLHTAKVRSIFKDAKVIGNVPRHYAKRITKRIKKPLEIN